MASEPVAKWRRRPNGTRELYVGDGDVIAVMEPARIRGHWWWTTWGHTVPDLAGYCWSQGAAIDALASALGRNVPR